MKCKWLICISVIFLLFALKRCETGKIVDIGPKGACECGAFEKRKILIEDKAIIHQIPMNVTCDKEGNEVCQTMCKALAEAARIKGPTLICSYVLNANKLEVSVFSRSCFDKNWIYTNLTSKEPICCKHGEPVTCETTFEMNK